MKKMLFLIISILLVINPAFAHYEEGFDPHICMMGYGGWFYGPIMMILFWGGLILLIIYLLKNFNHRN